MHRPARKGRSAVRALFRVGTSGWSYDWEEFYPADLKSRDYLAYYSRRFGTVEVNYSFYHLPRPSTYEKWRDETPDGFLFALKLSRFITHIRALKEVEEPLERFFTNAAVLGTKLGPVLVQLPPRLAIDTDRLALFLDRVRRGDGRTPRLAFEFRHPSWFEGPDAASVIETMKRFGAAIVFAHSSRYPYPEDEPVTAEFVYLRFHGPEGLFASRYGREGLERWRPKIRDWLRRGLDVYAYFNNDVHGYAVSDAATLIELAGA